MSWLTSRRQKTALFGSLLCAVLLVVAACGSSASSQSSPGKATDTASVAESPAATPNWIWPFLTVGNTSLTNFETFDLLYRPLYTFGHGNSPGIDESLSLAQEPSWSADGKTATITLKGNYKWSDGEPVTAADVLFMLNMLKAEKKNEGYYVPGYIPDDIASMSASGQTLTITTDKVYSQHWFLYNQLSWLVPWPMAWDLSGPGQKSDCATDQSDCPAVFAYLSAQSKDQSMYAQSPVWSIVDGPWKVKSWNSDGNISMVPNHSYSGPVKPTLKQLNFLPFTTDSAEFNVLKSGNKIDVGYIPTQDIDQPHPADKSPLVAGPNPLSSNYTLSTWFLYGFNYMPLNFNGPQGDIIGQLYFRQALQSLVNQPGLIKSQAKGYGIPTLGPVPTIGTQSSLLAPGEKKTLYPFSIAKAKSLLSSNGWTVKPGGTTTCAKPGSGAGECGAGIAAGTPLKFLLPYATGSQTTTSAMDDFKSNASQVGIQLTLRGETFDAVISNYGACQKGTAACNWAMANWGGGWVYVPNYYPTGETLFQTGASSNAGNYSDSAVDQDIKQSLTSNAAAPFVSYEQALAKNIPVLYQPNYTYQLLEVGNGLKGVTPNSPFGYIFPEEWRY